jgi:hypothetical protein
VDTLDAERLESQKAGEARAVEIPKRHTRFVLGHSYTYSSH